jgi:DNA-binding response OmpR family regulator
MGHERRRVLLVDDEEDIVKIVRKRLELDGFEVLVAVEGKEALAKAKAECPDLIILDIMLPRVSGFEVCAKLKQDERSRQIPIVIYTGKSYEGDEQICQELGADAYVSKFDGLPALLDRVNALLRTREPRR